MQYKKGQVLLIIVMLLATAITVVLSISFTTTTDTQITKLEEESQKALAAAEAGIEAALQNKNTVALSELPGLAGFTGSADMTNAIENEFTSPLLQTDEQYTFYLDEYDSTKSPPFENTAPYNGSLTVYYGSDSTTCSSVSLELTFVYYDGVAYKQKRFIADNGDKLGSNTSDIYSSTLNPKEKISGIEFNCKTSTININPTDYPGIKVLIVRSLFNQTKVGFLGSVDFKPQGNFITSTATSSTGVTKKVQLFQSYPQIPSEFFITRF